MDRASKTYRCRSCLQLLPFNERGLVPDACLRRCRGHCDWEHVGPTEARVYARAERDGPIGNDGLPAPAPAPAPAPGEE